VDYLDVNDRRPSYAHKISDGYKRNIEEMHKLTRLNHDIATFASVLGAMSSSALAHSQRRHQRLHQLHTHTHTHREMTGGDLIICSMLCYSNGTDKNALRIGTNVGENGVKNRGYPYWILTPQRMGSFASGSKCLCQISSKSVKNCERER